MFGGRGIKALVMEEDKHPKVYECEREFDTNGQNKKNSRTDLFGSGMCREVDKRKKGGQFKGEDGWGLERRLRCMN